MKEYFTIILPVEGEIKNSWLLVDGVMCKYRDEDDTHIYMTHPNGHTWARPKKDARTRYTLMLCTNNIEIGEEYQDKEGNVYVRDEDDIYDELQKMGFKVIGQISSNATWVTESDEFDVDELAYLMGSPPEHPWYFKFSTIKVWDIEGMKKYPIAVRCSNCKSFH